MRDVTVLLVDQQRIDHDHISPLKHAQFEFAFSIIVRTKRRDVRSWLEPFAANQWFGAARCGDNDFRFAHQLLEIGDDFNFYIGQLRLELCLEDFRFLDTPAPDQQALKVDHGFVRQRLPQALNARANHTQRFGISSGERVTGDGSGDSGGAIALGHPLGCSGARIVTSLIHELQRRSSLGERARYGLATLCVGVGQGEAAIIERI